MEPTTLRKPERGEAVLNATRAFIGRFATLPSQAALDLATLWVAHTHVRDNDGLLALACSPRFVVLSDEPGSGKTRVLELITLLSHRGQMTIDLTPPAFALTVAQDRATVTIDETDVLFGTGKAKAILRSLLNSGYRAKGADWKRANGDSLNVFGPVAMAGLGARFRTSSDLSALRSRCFMIDMHRGTPPDPYKPRLHDPYAEALAADLARWAADKRAQITEDVPGRPGGHQGPRSGALRTHPAARERRRWPLARVGAQGGPGDPDRRDHQGLSRRHDPDRGRATDPGPWPRVRR